MEQPERIGILGGTFDPIHNGHLAMARAALGSAGLSRVLFVVAARPPHKRDDTDATPEQRLAMVQAAVADDPEFEASDIELHRAGPSYTSDTLGEIHTRYPDAEIYLILGLDSLVDLPTWHEPERILELAKVLAIPRTSDRHVVPDALNGRYEAVPFEPVDVSSTEIRECVSAGRSIEGHVPKPVAQLIHDQGMYRARVSDSARG